MWISLIADGVIAVLLGVTIFYCFLVSRRLTALRSGKDELKQVVEDLTVATTNAQMSIEKLKESGREIAFTLEEDVRKGRALSDELSLMIEAGNNLANRLAGGRELAANVGKSDIATLTDDQLTNTGADAERSSADGDLNVRARVQVQSDASRLKSDVAPKQNVRESVVETELLKALRRAR